MKNTGEHLLRRPANLTQKDIQFLNGRIRESVFLKKEFQTMFLKTDITNIYTKQIYFKQHWVGNRKQKAMYNEEE